jgi:hypothetical protein
MRIVGESQGDVETLSSGERRRGVISVAVARASERPQGVRSTREGVANKVSDEAGEA